jgi:hypothetical protein
MRDRAFIGWNIVNPVDPPNAERSRHLKLAKTVGKDHGRTPDTAIHQCIVAFRTAGQTIEHTAALAGCSVSQVKRI